MKKKYHSPFADVQEFDLKDVIMMASAYDAELPIEEEEPTEEEPDPEEE